MFDSEENDDDCQIDDEASTYRGKRKPGKVYGSKQSTTRKSGSSSTRKRQSDDPRDDEFALAPTSANRSRRSIEKVDYSLAPATIANSSELSDDEVSMPRRRAGAKASKGRRLTTSSQKKTQKRRKVAESSPPSELPAAVSLIEQCALAGTPPIGSQETAISRTNEQPSIAQERTNRRMLVDQFGNSVKQLEESKSELARDVQDTLQERIFNLLSCEKQINHLNLYDVDVLIDFEIQEAPDITLQVKPSDETSTVRFLEFDSKPSRRFVRDHVDSIPLRTRTEQEQPRALLVSSSPERANVIKPHSPIPTFTNTSCDITPQLRTSGGWDADYEVRKNDVLIQAQHARRSTTDIPTGPSYDRNNPSSSSRRGNRYSDHRWQPSDHTPLVARLSEEGQSQELLTYDDEKIPDGGESECKLQAKSNTKQTRKQKRQQQCKSRRRSLRRQGLQE